MIKLTCAICSAFVICLLSFLAAAADNGKDLPEPLRLISPIQVGEKLTLKLWGFGQVSFTDTELEDDLKWSNLRLTANLDGKRLGFGAQINLADLQNTTDGNWLRELYVQCKINDEWKLRAGRLLIACGRGYQIPGPFLLETVDYPLSQPWASYAYGLQAWYTTKDWSVIIDLTGKSGLPFDSPENFDRLESSARIRRNFEQGYVGGTTEVSSEWLRLGIDAGWNPSKQIFLRGEFDYADNFDARTSNRFGGYLLAGVRPVQWWEISIMPEFNQDLPKYWTETVRSKGKDGKITVSTVDKQSSGKTTSDIVLTTRFIGRHDLWSLKFGYVLPLEDKKDGGPDKGKLQGQFQVRF